MGLFGFLHAHPTHRSRQMRWILPGLVVLFVAVVAALGVVYGITNREVGDEFFRAHKTISHTGQLFEHGIEAALAVLTVLLLAMGLWAFRVTHRIVRPLHCIHRALDELVGGNLGVRLELHRHDEFQEVGAALNRLVDEFRGTITRVHDLTDRIDELASRAAEHARDEPAQVELKRLAGELNDTMEFFRVRTPRVIAEEDS